MPRYQALRSYIKFLFLYTLPKNDFYVAVGFLKFLCDGSSKETLELYRILNVDDIKKESSHLNKVNTKISNIMHQQFCKTFQTNHKRLTLYNKSKYHGDAIYRILTYMIPWQTSHIQDEMYKSNVHQINSKHFKESSINFEIWQNIRHLIEGQDYQFHMFVSTNKFASRK